MRPVRLISWILLLSVALFAACANEGEAETAVSSTPLSPSTTQAKPTAIPTETAVSLPSPTILPTPTPTNQQKAKNFTGLLAENGGCELPCWWGIAPGESAIATIADQFVPQGFEWWEEWNQLDYSNSESGAIIIFEAKENLIQSIKVGGRRGDGDRFVQDWGKYSLDQMLTLYGLPSQVFVYYPYRPDPGSDPSYNLFIFYEELGIEINYAGKVVDGEDGKSRACPQLAEESLINLFLYQPGKIDNVVEMVIPSQTVSFIAGPDTVYDLISWEQATDTSLESFYETFRQTDLEACFDFRRYWTSNDD